ncbi:uncharacterized protein LOC129759287 [Uranotaenia lowii]|uniref:uncharacterized protein LOC129759287 n=1 Tax=Uranotaenia lowii TaxID=190385 RepID=UPI00247A37CA|nr:uncharacterized protein LOC129759287 [Uranotaenia lowii]
MAEDYQFPCCDQGSDFDSSVRCNKCEEWYHFCCVNEDEEDVEGTLWFCNKCICSEPSLLESFGAAGQTATRRQPHRAAKKKGSKEPAVGKSKITTNKKLSNSKSKRQKEALAIKSGNKKSAQDSGSKSRLSNALSNGGHLPGTIEARSESKMRKSGSESSKSSVREAAKRELQRLREISMKKMEEEEIELKLLEHKLKTVQREREEMESRHVQERLAEETSDSSEDDSGEGDADDFLEKVEAWNAGQENQHLEDPVAVSKHSVSLPAQAKQSTMNQDENRKRSSGAKPKSNRACRESIPGSISSIVSDFEAPCGVMRKRLPAIQKVPTHLQIAARQVYPKTLPKFSGRPEEWPMFISAYEQANESCGFTDAENLVRLQEALLGKALETVRNRLLLPENVPKIIEKLRKRFGNPEILSTMLAYRIQRLSGPSSEDLESLIEFGSAVEEFTEHMKAAKLFDHLKNPIFMKSLVQKLPPCYVMEWVEFKRRWSVVDLETFGNFMEELVDKALEGTFEQFGADDVIKGKKREKFGTKGLVNLTVAEPHDHCCCTCTQRESTTDMQKNQQAVGAIRSVTLDRSCSVCKKPGHFGRNCNEFLKLNLEERWSTTNRLQLCPLCLFNHGGRECFSKRRCNVNQCQKRHHPMLHWEPTEGTYAIRNCNNHHRSDHSVLYRIMPVTLYSLEKQVHVLALIDEGSSITLIDNELANQLGAEGEREPLQMSWANGMSSTENESSKLTLKISGKGSDKKYDLLDARTVKNLDLPMQELSEFENRYMHFEDIKIPTYSVSAPKLLIGINNIHLIAPLESRVGELGEPIAVQCKLGWTLYGPRPGVISNVNFMGHHRCNCDKCCKSDREMNDALKQYFQLEAVGVSPVPLETKEDLRAREILQKTTRRVGERFETGLLWREDKITFPESYKMAVNRMRSFEARMNRNLGVKEAIEEQIADYIARGYAHRITQNELRETKPEKVWYLPLNFVTHPKKPGKIRLIWDAAAKVKGVSLNDKLLKGPDMITSLPAVINGFRERKIAFGGDIRQMFHQIQIRAEDRQAQRFLYRSNSYEEPQIYVMDVVTFGARCSPCISQFVKNLNAREHKDECPEAVEAIVNKHFIDDYFDSTDTEEEAVERAISVKSVHAAGGFEIRNWVSNSVNVLEKLEASIPESSEVKLIKIGGDVERVLGVSWSPKEDAFQFSTEMHRDLEPYMTEGAWPTKRIALRCVMSMFDPKQFLAPLLIHGRILMQDVWRSGIGWDDKLEEDQFKQWLRWISLFPLIEKVRIPRCYLGNMPSSAYESVQLHIFTDAGEDAYGCVAYLRFVHEGAIHCSFVEAKAKVSPLQHMSVPRKELQAAELGTRLAKSISETHSFLITQRVMWTDSRAVYSWVRSERKKYKEFVAHRVGQILSVTNPEDWRWVPTKNNPADDITKWGKATEVHSCSRWFQGPDFLYDTEEHWPDQCQTLINVEEEFRARVLFHEILLPEGLFHRINQISRWNVLVRMVATVYRYMGNCRKLAKNYPIEALPTNDDMSKKSKIPNVVVPLRQEEYMLAENCLWRIAQNDEYGDEIVTLTRNQKLPKEEKIPLDRTSTLYDKSPFLDEYGVIRMEGRTEAAEYMAYDSKFPIILPKNHLITWKLIEYFHQQSAHGSREMVVNEIRQRFYIGNLRSIVEKVSRECLWCKIRKAKPHIPRMAPLPRQRMAAGAEPFSFVGIDYFGPLEVAVGRRREKRWVALFTCMTTRGVHLEVAHSLTTESCKMAIRRFVKRRRSPVEIFSDNGTNFIGASRELYAEIQKIHADCSDTFTNARTRWSFNPPSAPHMGGVWERMVRSVKEALNTLLDGGRLTDEILLTTLVEAEDLINSRPLTYVSTNSRDDPAALTPNHFLKGVSAECLPPRNPVETAAALRSKYCRAQQLADKMWERWCREYFPGLNKRPKWFNESRQIKPGDLVFVMEDNHRKRGLVTKVFEGSDGRVRSATVKTDKGERKRPVAKLAVLEIIEE